MNLSENKNPNLSNEKFWYAFYTKSRHEFKAEMDFESFGLEHYLPTITRLKQWSDRKKKVTEPLFKGYIFAKVNEYERGIAIKSDAIVNTVMFNGEAAHVQDFQIANLKRLLDKNPKVFVTDKIEIGAHVVINSGPFEGIEGVVFTNDNDDSMLAISCDLLKRSVVVRLPAKDVKKLTY